MDDLLDISRIAQGKFELRRETVDLCKVATNAVQTAEPRIDARSHTLAVALPGNPVCVEAEPIRLEQVIINLLGNAAKYTEPGGHILLRITQEQDVAVIRVRDTGIGIAPEKLPQVFDMFDQLGLNSLRSQGGLGIGLALAKRLVNLHGGRIEARSDGVGQGSEFIVYLPLLQRA